MNVDMIWDTPPDKGKRSSKWSEVADRLRANPGKWAKLKDAPIARNAHGLAGRLRTKWGDDFEVIARATGDGSAGVWARYQPDPPVWTPEEIVVIEDTVLAGREEVGGGGAGL